MTGAGQKKKNSRRRKDKSIDLSSRAVKGLHDTNGSEVPTFYDGLALISDPIHGYISFTVPDGNSRVEQTEKDLIDSAWMQRLRYIYQLQSARWVFPSAEHSRFQHSLGAMHVAGRFAKHLYPTLKKTVKQCPSECYVEEVLRIAALLHDIGHGPFGHFFDDNVLDEYQVTHEMIGQEIITRGLGKIIKRIRRSPHGLFAAGEEIRPEEVAFLIGKKPNPSNHRFPKWLVFLQPLLSGIYTADNLDYVLRDAYMCGVAIGPVDLNRLIHYTFYTEKGMTLHRVGLSALNMFLNARLYMYTNVYYHRTTRAIDLHLKDIFRDTVKLLYSHNPIKKLDGYLNVTDWSLLEEVRGWKRSPVKKKRDLYPEWQQILGREVKWKMAYDRTLPLREMERGRRFLHQDELEAEIRYRLPERLKKIPFRIDMASQDPRPLNPLMMGDRQIYVYNASTKTVSKEALKEYFDYIPAKIILCRIFAPDHHYDDALTVAAESVLADERASIKTNV